MGIDKSKVMELFRKKPEDYWQVRMFREQGWERKRCKCGVYFWTLDSERTTCGDSSCEPYSFIGNPPTKRKFDLIESWKTIEKYFVKHGHTSVPRYPVICRWFPGLEYTIASIVDFMRSAGGQTSFELPADPLIVPQVCLRFNDIPNIGVSGRHQSSFTMVGQHAMKAYWKDECVAYDQELLNKEFGVPAEKITWIEDIWAGPNAFGPSIEYFVNGLEVGNAVFTSFLGTIDDFKPMENRVIDMGAGLERFAWLTQGTPTQYQAVFGPVVRKMLKEIDYDERFFANYSKLAGGLNADEGDLDKELAAVAKQMGLSPQELSKKTRAIQAVFAVCDHARTLAFVIADRGLPSNVGGGYNYRVVLRRALNLIKEQELPFTLESIAHQHADYLKPLYPELADAKDQITEILAVEERKYGTTLEKAHRTIRTLIERKLGLTDEKLIELYDSQGITPEMFLKADPTIHVPSDFYARVTERHGTPEKKGHQAIVEVKAPITVPMWNTGVLEFEAKVLDNIELHGQNWVVLDKTAFYPEGGGQDHDTGYLDNVRVHDCQKIGDVVIHRTDAPVQGKVRGKVDAERRKALTAHHTATHVINGAALRTLGRHVWQAGAHKSPREAHLDITHYDALTDEQVRKIEELANRVVAEDRVVTKKVMPRPEAEAKYGFHLYQGGAVPQANLRIVSIADWDTEACGGTHADRTGEVGLIVIKGTEKIQDGIVRITFTAGEPAKEYIAEMDKALQDASELLLCSKADVPHKVKALIEEVKRKHKAVDLLEKGKAKQQLESLEPEEWHGKKVLAALVHGNAQYLRELSKQSSADVVFLVADDGSVFAASAMTNVGALVASLAKEFGGGGGGPPAKGEGKVPPKNAQVLLDKAKARLKEALK
jgi:alanyl-tRNA synthetase